MKETAKGLAQFGRYGDNNLVHVSNKELRGLEQLTGRKFTQNPHTGLPEAFGWADLIPIAAGVAGTVVSGGNPAVGALAAGATRTGVSAAQGKSTEQALTEGIVAGATTYAGGQLLSGVGEAGTAAAAGETASQGAVVTPTAGDAAGAVVTPTAGDAAGAVVTEAPPSGSWGANQMQPANGGQLNFNSANASSGPSYPDLTPSEVSAAAKPEPTFGERMSANYEKGVARTQNVYENPGTAASKVGENVWNDPKSAAIFAGGTYAQTSGMLEPNKEGVGEQQPYDPSKYPERFPSQPRQWNEPSSNYQPGYSAEYRYFAKGGLASLRTENGATENLMNEAKAALLGEHPKPREAIERFRNVFGDGALKSLQDRLVGGRVKGAGGGLDDLVPGDIEGRQRVRLADSEFVLPADIVSAIGDGSTDHGVRRLHEMMDNIRKQKTGSTKQPARLKKGTLIHEQGD